MADVYEAEWDARAEFGRDDPFPFVPMACKRCCCPEFKLAGVNIFLWTADVKCAGCSAVHVVRVTRDAEAWVNDLTNAQLYKDLGVETLPVLLHRWPRRTKKRVRIILH
ncbi:MAG: hypothetical protein WC700_10455 [Gemmatimonadaceae bacterium]